MAEVWASRRPYRLWRAHSDCLLQAFLERWWPAGSVGRVLKTDLFDEAFSGGAAGFLRGRAQVSVGMDLSLGVARSARTAHPGLSGIAADARSLPFGSALFDVVVSPSTLDHFDSREELIAALREIGRVLRPGGTLLLTLDNPLNPVLVVRRVLPFGFLHRLGLLPYRVGVTLGPRCLRRELEALGYEVREVGALMHCPRVAAVALARWLERMASARSRKRFLAALRSFEGLGHLPTRFLTGHFVAVVAVKQ